MIGLLHALRSLGYKGTVITAAAGYNRLTVKVNGTLVGIWDLSRGTFVD